MHESPEGSSLTQNKSDERYIMQGDSPRDVVDVELGTYGMSFYPGARPGGIPNGNNRGMQENQSENAVAEIGEPQDGVFMVQGARQNGDGARLNGHNGIRHSTGSNGATADQLVCIY